MKLKPIFRRPSSPHDRTSRKIGARLSSSSKTLLDGVKLMPVNSAMLVIARESRGWTQKDLATPTRLAQATISKYEIGALPVPNNHRDAIAGSLNYEVELLEQPDLLVGLGGDFLYRKRARLS